MKNKIAVTASLDNLLGLGRFDSFKYGLYILKLFSGIMVDIVMYITVLSDGTLKTTVEEVNLRECRDTVLHEENMLIERVCNIVKNQFSVSAALYKISRDSLEKMVGELSEVETSNVKGKIDLEYHRVVSLGQSEVELLFNRGKYICTIYSPFLKPQKFYTMDIDKVETLLSETKKKYDTAVKRVIEEELSKIA